MHPLKQGPLTQEEHYKFDAARKRAIQGVVVAFIYAGLLAINQKFLKIELHIAAMILPAAAITIWTLIQLFSYKCPRCGTTPLTTRTSLDGTTLEVGRYVASHPKSCYKCGVSFALPKPSEKHRDKMA